MSRWINVDELTYYGNHLAMEDEELYHNSQWVYRSNIDEAPSIDLVRCRECKWAKANGTYQWCGRLDSTAKITADDFCSYGERGADDE